MAANKETSIGIKVTADLRNYVSKLQQGQTETKKFQKNVSTNLGSVKSAFSSLMAGDITSFPAFFRSATAAAGGFSKGLQGVKVALISTGIGAILVGIGLAIAALTQYFKGTEEGQIAFMKVMNNVKAYIQPVLSMFGQFGKAIYQLFSGDFKAAWNTAKNAVAGVGDQIKKNTANLGELNALEEQLIKQRRATSSEEKRLLAEISELRNKGNQTEIYSAQQRAAFISQALDKQNRLSEIRNKLAEDELQLGRLKADQGDNTIADNDEINALEERLLEIKKQGADESRRILATQQSITREIQGEITARQKVMDQLSQTGTDIDTALNLDSGQLQKQAETEINAAFKNLGKDAETPDAILGPLGQMKQRLAELKEAQELALNPEMWQQYQEKIQGVEMQIASFTEKSWSMKDSMASLSGSFGSLSNSIGGTAGTFAGFVSFFLQQIPVLITQIAALTATQVASSGAVTAAKGTEAIAAGTAASQSVPFPFNLVALAATIGAIISALATTVKAPKLADGGIAYGRTLAEVGEYSNAKVDPEIISPLSKLRKLIQPDGTGGTEVLQPIVNFDEEGLYLAWERGRRKREKRTGK